MFEDKKTLIDIMNNTIENFGENDYLKYRENDEYKTILYKDFAALVKDAAAGLYDLGVRKDTKVGIISENMYKWLITDMAIISLGAIDVPRGSDSTNVEISYILKHSDSQFCFVEDPEQAEKIISIKKELPKLKYLILLKGEIKDIKSKKPLGLTITNFDNLIYQGKKVLNKHEKKIAEIQKLIKEDNVVTIIYTSGTTGRPKGVMLTHKNIMHNIKSLPDIFNIKIGGERWLSILPVWHVFERTIEYIILATAGLMCYSKPAAKFLLPDFAEVKPTFMVSVPRIWEALYQGIEGKLKRESKLRYGLFKFFLKIGLWYKGAIKTLLNRVPLFKKPFFLGVFFKKIGAIIIIWNLWFLYLIGKILVFNKIKEKTGGKLRIPISGGGALPSYVENFFSGIGIEIYEGWGLTETSPVIGVRTEERFIARTVGPPAPGVEIMIGDENWQPLPNQSEKGIVYIRGDNVMKGYYKDPEKTNLAISKDGWFNTGDLGRMTITGDLQLTGRAKDTIVLIGGENVEPGPIEDKILEDPMIHQVMIVGQDKKVLGALIVPNEENLLEFADKKKINYKSLDDLIKNEEIIEIYKEIARSRVNTKHGFRDYERITYIKLLKDPFEVGKELTHSLKIKRNVVADKYKKEIEDMFK